jgi:hypothetical protein
MALAADPVQPVRLDYLRAPGAERCPDEQVFRDVIRARMSHDPFAPTAETRLIVTITREGPFYKGRAELRDRSGALLWPRVLPPFADCHSVVEGLGLAVSVKLDPVGAPAPTPTPPLAPPQTRPDSALSPEPQRHDRFRIGATAVLGLGVAPRPAAGVAVDLGFRPPFWPTFSLSVEVRAYPPARGPAETGPAQIRTWQITGAAVPCARWSLLFGCAVLELGALSATSNAVHPQTATLFHLNAGPRVGVEWAFTDHLALRVSGDLLFAPVRQALRIEGQPQWTAPVAAGAVGLGLVTFF